MEVKRRFWKRRRLVFAVPVVLVVVLFLAAECRPSWYRPVGLDELGFERARRDAANTADWISGRVVAGEPFELELSEIAVNEWLLALLHHRPDWREPMQAGFRDPFVSFHDKEMRLAGVVERSGWRAIATLVLNVAVSTDGQWIELVVRRVHLGVLAIPGAWIHGWASEPLMALFRDRFADMSDNEENGRSEFELLQVQGRVMGLRVKNRWIWPNGRRPIRAAEIQMNSGRIRLLIEPNL